MKSKSASIAVQAGVICMNAITIRTVVCAMVVATIVGACPSSANCDSSLFAQMPPGDLRGARRRSHPIGSPTWITTIPTPLVGEMPSSRPPATSSGIPATSAATASAMVLPRSFQSDWAGIVGNRHHLLRRRGRALDQWHRNCRRYRRGANDVFQRGNRSESVRGR